MTTGTAVDGPAKSRQALLVLRPAQATDQVAIRGLVRRAHLNTLSLQWRRFVVVEDLAGNKIAGVGQVRIHGDGAQELASIAVEPSYQRRGIGRAVVSTLLARTPDPLYLFCRAEMGVYYRGFGFVRAGADRLPASLAWRLRAVELFLGLSARVMDEPLTVIAMVRDSAQL